MKQQLTNDEVILFAEAKGVDPDEMIKIKRFLDHREIRNLLIQTEYNRRTSNGMAIKKDVVKSISRKYNVSCSYVETLVYDKVRNKKKQCVRCNRYISRYTWNKNDCVCDRCNDIIKFTYDKERSVERDEISQGAEHHHSIS